MKKIYSCALSAMLAAASALSVSAAQGVNASLNAMYYAGYSVNRTPGNLLKASALPFRAPAAAAADASEAPASIVGKSYVVVYNDLTYDLNCAMTVKEGTDGGIILEGFAEGYDVNATYDPATGKISIPTGVVVGTNSTYGDITIHALVGNQYSDSPITGTVGDGVITFNEGLYGTVVYEGEQGGLLVMTQTKATEANGKMTYTITDKNGNVTEHPVPLVVTKKSETTLSVVGLSNFYAGRYYEVPFTISESAKTATLTFGTPVDAAKISGSEKIFYLGGINAVGFIDNLTMGVVTSDINTLMTADAGFYGYSNGQNYSGFQFSGLKMEVDFNIFTGEVSGGGDEDTDTPTIDGIIYQLDRTNSTATVTGCLATVTNAAIPAQITSAGNTYDVVAIAKEAFMANSTVTSLTIPASVKSIGQDAFRNLRGIKNVYLPALEAWCAVEIANGNANPIYNLFSASSESRWGKLFIDGLPAPTDIVIPEGVTAMSRSFYGYKPMTSVSLPSTLTKLGDQAFANCAKLTEVEVPAGVTEIGSAFWGCEGLKTVKFHEGLKTIKGSTFYSCKALETVNFPEGLETIGSMSFSSCKALTSISLPTTLTTLGMMAFDGCVGLTEIKSAAALPPTAQMYAFDGVDTSIPVYVPAASIADYQAAEEWKNFTNYQEMAGITSAVADDLNAPVEYYNLSGIRVDNPSNGLYIRRQGCKVTKVIVR